MATINFITPLTTTEGRKPFDQIRVGDLVTVRLCGDKLSGARIERIAYGAYFVKLVGLAVPEPYKIGDRLPIQAQLIVDWE